MAEVCVKSHHLKGAEAGHLNPSTVMAVEVEAVERGQKPQVDTGNPHQHRVLETLSQVRVGRVPRSIPVLQQTQCKKSKKVWLRECIYESVIEVKL